MMEVTFEEAPWERKLAALRWGDTVSALELLTMLEGEDEASVEDALMQLEENHIALDVSGLANLATGGDLALRLRQEKQMAESGSYLRELEETDPLRMYLEELARTPAAGDENLLAMECMDGSQTAMERLTNLSLSRVVELAGELAGRGVLLLDLIQEGSLGLWQGILSYAGGEFAPWRDWWIRQYMAKSLLLQARASGAGQRLKEGMEDYRDVDQRLLTELGRNPTLEEIAEAMHVTAETAAVYASMVDMARSRQKVDASREEPEPTPDDEQAVEDTAYFQSRQRILELLSALTEQEQKLLTLRFGLEGGLPLSPEETGKKLGLTAHEVVNMEAAALAKLRNE